MLNQFRYHAGHYKEKMTCVEILGSDSESFLHNQSSFDIKKMKNQSFHLVSFLDSTGRVESYGILTKKDEGFDYFVPSRLLEQTLERLNRFLISEDVEFKTEEKELIFVLGPAANDYRDPFAFEGTLFDEFTYLQFSPSSSPEIPKDVWELWRNLTGYPSFDGSDYQHTLINNLRLYDLSVSQKGCYPGQETVSKIATRRGAAYGAVLLEVSRELSLGDVLNFERKIGTAKGCYQWGDKFYLAIDILRDFRVENLKLKIVVNGEEVEGIVKYFPLLSGNRGEKAQELFYEACEDFRLGKYTEAEEKYLLSIAIDPMFADSYEGLGVMLGREERFEEAINLMKTLSEINPKSVLAHTNMSLYLMRLGKIEEAEEQKSLATIKSFQGFGDEAKAKKAEEERKEAQRKEWETRESMFKQVLEIDPEDTLANFGLGSISVERGEWETARFHLEKVLKEDPKYSVAYLALGKALKGLGLKDEAKAIWTEGIKVAAAKGDLMPANQMQSELNF